MAEAKIEHSYPHCWRCHNPVIFRATEQWFISMEAARGRQHAAADAALDEIKKVKWDPGLGRRADQNMIATRPDWCIFRQRVWGVPIAVFFCEGCGKLLESKESHSAVVELFAREARMPGTRTKPKRFCLPGPSVQVRRRRFRKEMDIIDVWFESGSSHAPC